MMSKMGDYKTIMEDAQRMKEARKKKAERKAKLERERKEIE